MPLKAGVRGQGLGVGEEQTKPQSLVPDPPVIAVIAGMGALPVALAAEARKMGYRVTGIALRPLADDSLRSFADDFHEIGIGSFGGLIKLLGKLSIRDAVMAGKVPKELLYKHRIIPDLKAVKLLFSLKDQSDDTIMKAVVDELEKNGVKIHETTLFTQGLLAPEGVMTPKKPTKEQQQDIEFGYEIAKRIGGLDIGQTVVVKDKAVMAVEAIEGTDEAVKRGGALAGKEAVVIKVSKPEQDRRFDVPVVGANTLHSMKSVGAKVLALEAEKCIILDRENFIKTAGEMGIVVVGVKELNR
ncbi:MAG: UDP-2,3-diacylglucosamine diphosphatase LpxI [Nitrospirae bacterium]|nr:UDP-2,3-diacylglucosamine diphosphatase LpxI [Nitrospirota bacterium]